MQYRKDIHGEDISVLGFGCMRFTKKGNGIDIDKAEQEILAAYQAGVNYYDTAYIYPGSEECLGIVLERNNLRDHIKIATKLPQYLIKSAKAVDRYFEEELKRLRTDHIDYYLMHMLTDIEAWRHLEQYGIREWIAENKQKGRIRNIGFSFHGNTDMFLKILDAYDWDFCQIQYNYMDENTQAGRKGLEEAHRRGIPVIIMEPLRGGKLVELLPGEAKKKIAAHPKHMTPAELAFRWLYDQEGVTCVLSGMNSVEMVQENCRIASSAGIHQLDEEDFALIQDVKKLIEAKMKVPCTGCAYCMPCPNGVDIPGTFRCYNRMFTESKKEGRHEYFQTIGLRQESAYASQCVGCGKCERHCPQHIHIIDALKEADKALRPLPYKAAIHLAKKFIMKA